MTFWMSMELKQLESALHQTEGGKNLHLHWETGQIDVAGIRTMLNQLKTMYPDAETITTPKVPGYEALREGPSGNVLSLSIFRLGSKGIDR